MQPIIKRISIALALTIAVVSVGCAKDTAQPEAGAILSEDDGISKAAERNAELFESVCEGSGHIGRILAVDFGFNDIETVETCICIDAQTQSYDVILRITDGKAYHIKTSHGNVQRIDEI